MPASQDVYALTQFGDIYFPGETHHLDGKYRHHVHEYPHSPGGAPEKLGRALYHVTVRGNFQSTFPRYPDLYPNGMNKLRGYYELGTTLTFQHPTAGRFPAFIVSWSQVRDARMLSGEKVDIEFLEDQSAQFALAELVLSADETSIGISEAQLEQDLASVQEQLALTQNTLSIFDALQTAVNLVLAVQDTSKLYGNLYAARVNQVVGLCQQLDAAMDLQDARAWPLVADVQAVWQNALNISSDLQQQRVEIQYYTVPFTMPLAQVAINLYSDASRQSDLLSLNADVVVDPLSVTANTKLRYYPNTASQTIAQQAA